MEDARDGIRERVDDLYRTESRRVLATLIRLLGDFDLAEEALHDAFIAAMEQWAAPLGRYSHWSGPGATHSSEPSTSHKRLSHSVFSVQLAPFGRRA